MQFLAYCPHCEEKVTATPLLGDDELRRALDSGSVVEVIHLSVGDDHRWNLIKQEKENLRKHLADWQPTKE